MRLIFSFSLLVIAASLSLICSSQSVASNADAVTAAVAKQTIFVHEAQPVFTVGLPANPTTGYNWIAREYDKTLMMPVKHEFKPSSKKRIGASGTDVWTFKMKPAAFSSPLHTTLHMVYARSWEIEKSITSTIDFEITTEPSRATR